MKKTLILCNGHPPTEQLLRDYRANTDLFIAADGGGNIALEYDLRPDVVIGDLDSFREPDDSDFQIIFKPDQETNDLEKALQLAHQKKATEVHILGATGMRLDHTLKNLSVLKQFHSQFNVLRIRDTYGEIQLLESPFEAAFPIGTTLSLFPLSGTVSGITTTGLKYPLKDEIIKNGVRDGSSNEVIESPVHITFEEGDLLLFVAHQ